MAALHFLLIALISFWPLSRTPAISDQLKTFQKEDTLQCNQSIYAIDHENRAWQGDIKNKTESSDSITIEEAHPILLDKKIVSIFTDNQGKPLFKNEVGIFYDEDGTVITHPAIAPQTESHFALEAQGALAVDSKNNSLLSTLDKKSNLLLLEATDSSAIPAEW